MVATAVSDMVDMLQLEVMEEYWLRNWVCVAPMGSWSCLLMRETAQVWHAMLGTVGGTSGQPITCCFPKQTANSNKKPRALTNSGRRPLG